MFRKDKSGLNSQDWQIYKFLKNTSEHGIWVGMKELAYKFRISTREVRHSITRIRNCETIQKVLVSDYSKGYKFLTNSDADTDYINRKKIKALKELKQVYLDIKRINLNKQLKLVFDTKEREIIESLVEA